jgi:hypothetical protein
MAPTDKGAAQVSHQPDVRTGGFSMPELSHRSAGQMFLQETKSEVQPHYFLPEAKK